MRTTIVLVHGAFAESASWDGVIEPLMAEGHRVVAAPNPLRGLAADAASVSDVVRTIEGPVVLVAHSYGGAVISNVDRDAGEIVGLVYVNACALEPGENCFALAAMFPGSMLGEERCGRCRAATERPTSTSPRTASTTCSARTSPRRRPPSWPRRSAPRPGRR
jgi:pimeloyl-ACP methyl ester carboxylesterase